ncbi:NAD(P)/FAD-dependent oxidoreductase [Pyxidicoccus trucidator]|uniref:NAD(P)/FAD-dependent oxidoreductase n=1 Tax=Pyxidicoccus trucidator TaxID=2709662 RepID=UPI0013DB51F5|nr:FAD-dependent monooxygenase [Pyxidicoccus trucidator]
MRSLPPSDVSPRHAVVCGSSLAGLLTAGLLARHFERVTLVERDALLDSSHVRKGVPQGTQTHVLLKRGLDIAAAIFPGLLDDLQAAGTQVTDMSADCAWHVAGVWRKRIHSGVSLYSQTRPLFEWRVRSMLAALPNVRILDRHEVTGFLYDVAGTRVTGLRVRVPGCLEETRLEAELVVDAGGRGSRTPQWLEEAGFPRVEETRFQIDVGYATRLYRKPAGFDAGWKSMIISAELPRLRRFGCLFPVEGDRWAVTLSGWLKDYPPSDEDGFLAYARSLAQPHLYEAMKNAEPLGPIPTYRFSHSQWRHYERLPRVPEGLVVVGDAFCSFNPVYGQGITTSALLVEQLGESLRSGLGGLSRRYFEQAGRLLKSPWAMSTTEDLRLPELDETRPLGSSFLYWYGERFQRLTATDDEAVRTFMEVMHMLKPPEAIFSPRLFWKTLAGQPTPSKLPRGPEPLSARLPRAA